MSKAKSVKMAWILLLYPDSRLAMNHTTTTLLAHTILLSLTIHWTTMTAIGPFHQEVPDFPLGCKHLLLGTGFPSPSLVDRALMTRDLVHLILGRIRLF